MNGASRSAASIVAIALVLAGLPMTVHASHEGVHRWSQTDKVWNPTDGQLFGQAMAVDDTIFAVSSDAGVHVYEQTGSQDWRRVQTITTPPNPFADDGVWGDTHGQAFGHALAIDQSAGVLAIGAPRFDVTGNLSHHETDAGAVYVYEQAPNGTWQQAARFVGPVNSDFGEINGPFFGDSVDVHGDVIVAGARSANVDGEYLRGIARVFERQPDGSWKETAHLTNPSPWADEWDQFGKGVAATDGRIAIAAPGEATGGSQNAGAVHLYEPDPDGWQHTQRLTPPMISKAGQTVQPPMVAPNEAETRREAFGTSLAFDGDGSTLVAGAFFSNRLAGASPPTTTDSGVGGVDNVLTQPWGAAYVFEEASSGFRYAASLENPDREAYSGFGRDVAINDPGETVIVGAAWYGNQSEQSPIVKDGERWPPLPPWVSDHGIATHSGSATGTAYVFERRPQEPKVGDGWACSVQLSGDDTNNAGTPWGDTFGDGLGFAGDQAVVSAPLNGGSYAGSVYAFEPAGSQDPGTVAAPVGLSSECGTTLAPG